MFSEGQNVTFKDETGKTLPGKIMLKQGDGWFVRTETAIYLVPAHMISQR